MRMPALRQIDAGELARMARIRDVDDRGAARPMHVADVERRAVDPDLPAAGAVEVRHARGVRSARYGTLEDAGWHCCGEPAAARWAAATLEVRRFSRYRRWDRGPIS